MTPYLERQIRLVSRQRSAFLFMAVFALGAFFFPPLAILLLLALLSWWYLAWRIMSSKCPSCGENVGRVTPLLNHACRVCGEVFVEPPTNENGENQHLW